MYHPCARRLDGELRLWPDGAGERRRADLAPSARRHRGAGGGAARRRLHPALPGHRLALGQAHVGHLVGLGRAAHLGAGAVLPLSRLYRAGERLRRSHAAAPAPARSWRWSAWSICRSSNSPSIGGTRCTSRRASSAWAGPPSIASMLLPLLLMAVGFTLLLRLALLMLRMRTAILASRVRAARLGEVEASEPPRQRAAAESMP